MINGSHTLTKVVAVGAAAVVALVLPVTVSGCAPEPTAQTDPAVGDPTKKGQGQDDNESSWGEDSKDQYQYTTELPASFPTELLLPAEYQIVDTGERDANSWFLNVRNADQAAADAFWAEVVSANGFTVSDEIETSDGGKAATFTNAAFTVQALTITNNDKTVDISFEIQRNV